MSEQDIYEHILLAWAEEDVTATEDEDAVEQCRRLAAGEERHDG